MFGRFKRYHLPASHQNSGNMTREFDSGLCFPIGQVIEEEDGFQKDQISERASKDHFVKCRITRNRKGIRGQALFYEFFVNFPFW